MRKMKKIFIFLILSLFATNNLSAFEFEKRMQLFTEWLNINGYDQYLDKESDKVKFKLATSLGGIEPSASNHKT